MFEYTTTCTNPTAFIVYIYTDECKEITETYYESI